MLPYAEAKVLVAAYAVPTEEPSVSAEDVELALRRARVLDSEGRKITDADYVPTYSAARAIVHVLDLKLSKTITWVDVQTDGSTYSQSQVVTNLRTLRAEWVRKTRTRGL